MSGSVSIALTTVGFAELLSGAQAGEEWAFVTLYRSSNPLLIRFLRAQVASAAEDLASEIWLAVAAKIDDFRGGPVEWRAWLFTLAHRRVIDHRRRASRRRTDAAPPEVFADNVALDDPAQEAANRMSAKAAIDWLVRSLSEEQAEVVLLRVVGGLDSARVAEIVGRSPGWVRVVQHKAAEAAGGAVLHRRGGGSMTRRASFMRETEFGDEWDEERLLAGEVAVEDAPPGAIAIVSGITAAQGPSTPDEVSGAEHLASEMAVIVRHKQAHAAHRVLGFRAKTVLLFLATGAAAMGSAGVAAAANGSLPAPAQQVVAQALAHINVSVPTGHSPNGPAIQPDKGAPSPVLPGASTGGVRPIRGPSTSGTSIGAAPASPTAPSTTPSASTSDASTTTSGSGTTDTISTRSDAGPTPASSPPAITISAPTRLLPLTLPPLRGPSATGNPAAKSGAGHGKKPPVPPGLQNAKARGNATETTENGSGSSASRRGTETPAWNL